MIADRAEAPTVRTFGSPSGGGGGKWSRYKAAGGAAVATSEQGGARIQERVGKDC